jgi:hypothetical protein
VAGSSLSLRGDCIYFKIYYKIPKKQFNYWGFGVLGFWEKGKVDDRCANPV